MLPVLPVPLPEPAEVPAPLPVAELPVPELPVAELPLPLLPVPELPDEAPGDPIDPIPPDVDDPVLLLGLFGVPVVFDRWRRWLPLVVPEVPDDVPLDAPLFMVSEALPPVSVPELPDPYEPEPLP